MHASMSASPKRSKSESYARYSIPVKKTGSYDRTYLVVHLSTAPHPPRTIVVIVRRICLPLEQQLVLQVRVDFPIYIDVDRLLILGG